MKSKTLHNWRISTAKNDRNKYKRHRIRRIFEFVKQSNDGCSGGIIMIVKHNPNLIIH